MMVLVRAVSPTLDRCERSGHVEREPIDVERARRQHDRYVDLLAGLGCRVREVPPAPDLPDAVFVEDTAVVTDEVAVLTRPGAPSRRPEVEGVAGVLGDYRPLRRIRAPATVDGGDVMRLGQRVWVGRSGRTNDAGVAQLATILEPLGYEVSPVPVSRCLHLKSAVTAVGPAAVLLNPRWVDAGHFAGLEVLRVHPREPGAGNVLRIGRTVVLSSAHPRTRARVEAAGAEVVTIDVSELARAEGGLTCCSLRLDDPRP